MAKGDIAEEDTTLDEVSRRLGNVNNRYGASCPTKLVLSDTSFEYQDAEA